MNKNTTSPRFIVLSLFVLLLISVYLIYSHYNQPRPATITAVKNIDWPEYNGNGNRDHYSALNQITKENVGQLKVAWTYSSGGADTAGSKSQMQCNPVVVDGILYGVSANIQAFAIDASNGKEL